MRTDIKLAEFAWYLIQCKPRSEQKAWEHLNRQGFECFLPRIETQTTSTGKITPVTKPLFPGYLFLHMSAEGNWAALRSTRGVSRVVGFCGMPCQIDDAIIQKLKSRPLEVAQKPALIPGDKVHIGAGPLTDIDAIFLTMDGEQRVVLLLRLLNHQRPVKVPLAHLRNLSA